ncbi:MAG TPA: hypothetical protein VFA25_07970 [Actinomycetota bacterium]|jgi:hypothetical protein|nr:hypothetical protein [Actinomycetota bacterium]
MSDLPQRPDDRIEVPTPRPAAPRRPAMVTAAGILLLVAGGFSLVGGVIALGGGELTLPGFSAGDARWVAPLFFSIGILEALAGWLVLRLSRGGRILGIVLATAVVAYNVVQLGSTGASGLLTIALWAFVLYGLLAYGFVFEARSRAG